MKYIVINHENSKYYKGIPYIKKKEFKNNKDNIVIGKTRLREYKSNSNNKELDLLCCNKKEYRLKDRMFGFNKGYVWVGDDNYVLLKNSFSFLILLFLSLLLIVVYLCFNLKSSSPESNLVNDNPRENVPSNDLNEDSKLHEEKREENLYKYVPKREKVEEANNIHYTIIFDANEGEGTINSIVCNGNEACLLPKSTLRREGYRFVGWSTKKNGDQIYLDEGEVFNLSTKNDTKIVLYAMWHIESFNVEFLDYDGSVIQKSKYNYGDKIINPENPTRKGYTFLKWDHDIREVRSNLKIVAIYNINDYDISYDLGGGTFEKDAPSTYTVENDSFKIPSPQKVGYTFLGWTTEKEAKPNKNFMIEKGTSGDIKLLANYKPNSYRLIFNTNGAKEKVKPKIVDFDSNIGELSSVTKQGYKFVNWTDKNGNVILSDRIFDEPNDIIINANWTPITYDIKYNLIGGMAENMPISFNVESDTILIPNVEKRGYIFLGWSTKDDEDFKMDYKINKGTIGNIELTANYKPISYLISYHSVGGNGTMIDTKVKYNNNINLRKNEFVKEGYIFKGWSTEENGEVIYSDEQQVNNLTDIDSNIINLYAKWDIIKLSVKYYDLFGVVLKEEIVNYGNKSTPPADPYIDGYTFVGWNLPSEPIKFNTNYQAKYIINDYIIKYNLNTNSPDDTKEIKYNIESDKIMLPTPTREGYKFIGWTGDNGIQPQSQVTIPKGAIGNRNYKANWIANVYKVGLNSNEGLVTTDYIEVSYNSLYGILPKPVRNGYSFEGWYYNNLLIDDNTIMKISSDHELKADWKIKDYDITYNLSGGTLSSPIAKYTVESETILLPSPTREGYKFIGWTGDNGILPSLSVKIEKGSIGNKEYNANWQPINYNISYDFDGGSVLSQLTNYNIETNTFTLSQPTKEGYTFAGWVGSELNSATKNVTISKGSIGDRNYTATWNKNFHTVNYYVNNTLWIQKSVGYNDTLENLNAQTILDGYHTFHSWSGWLEKMPNHDVNLYATISEAFCRLTTGHGPYGNASGLLQIFRNAGWTGNIIEAETSKGNYMVITDYTLTRAQAEEQKNYIASHTNYNNYNFPYLFWVSISCTNGYAQAWTRGLGQSQFD